MGLLLVMQVFGHTQVLGTAVGSMHPMYRGCVPAAEAQGLNPQPCVLVLNVLRSPNIKFGSTTPGLILRVRGCCCCPP